MDVDVHQVGDFRNLLVIFVLLCLVTHSRPAFTVISTASPPMSDFPSYTSKNLQPPEKQPVMTFGTKAPTKAAEQDKPCFVRNRQRSLIGFEEKTVVGLDLRTCLHNCLHITTFYCASVNYNEFEKTCTLNGGNLHLNDVQLISSTSDYYENECSPEQKSDGKVSSSTTFRSSIKDRCFVVFPNSMLLTLESHLLEKASTIEHCRVECSRKSLTGGRPCGALNWIPHTKGCMLFEVGYDKRLIMPSSHVHFLVNKCAGEEKPRLSRSKVNVVVFVNL
ncbi:PAN domain protein [Teladorsagia circumcincta]|uniref:PAN domain protein n=1 Tax=Teladorsagia circumcincta TaxID=45464 RepID=A0A2G9UF90_TELCI|nr:PAN domain protein [Teladorsagia circumcincta]